VFWSTLDFGLYLCSLKDFDDEYLPTNDQDLRTGDYRRYDTSRALALKNFHEQSTKNDALATTALKLIFLPKNYHIQFLIENLSKASTQTLAQE
jgi:hypothetical protein